MTDSPSDREFTFSDSDFEQVRMLLHRRVGISLNDAKKPLVYARLARRLRALDLPGFGDYLAYLNSHVDEWEAFINALTTNLTAFFREKHHFEILADHLLTLRERPIRIWCAAASTGEEPYSIAMTAAETFASHKPPVAIVASDVDTSVLNTARQAEYALNRLDTVPDDLKRRWFMRGKGKNEGSARVSTELQALIEFRQINLLEESWGFNQPFDVIFCRNVMIYFDKPTQQKLIARMLRVLKPGGLYFAGHSESFYQSGDAMRPIGRTVYRAGPAPKDAAPSGAASTCS